MPTNRNRRRFLGSACASSIAAVAGSRFLTDNGVAAESHSKPSARKGNSSSDPVVDYRKHDRQIWEEELEEFVPKRVYDAHCHLACRANVAADSPSLEHLTEVPFSTLQAWESQVLPGREVHCLALAKPSIGVDVAAHNQFLKQEIAQDPRSRVNCLATPDYPIERLAADIKAPGVAGLKVYRFYSVTGDIADCRIHEFFPHEQMELANEHGLWVTLHLSRSDGCADKYNLDDLEEYTTKRYPRIKWILAHCARSFTYYPIKHAVDRLRGMPNIWYDLSAVTDVMPFVTLFQREKLSRLFYGSDGVDAVSFHGKYVVLGRAWQTFRADDADLSFPHCKGRPVLCHYEQLLAMKHAADIAGLSRSDVEGIFWNNATQALGV